jgi:hypothetical protein
VPRSGRPPSAVIDYRFRQRFRVPARPAFEWATDFAASDWELAGLRGRREVERVSPTMMRLTDRVIDARETGVTKVRVVQLYPTQLSWVSTHVAGPCRHSQFRYSIAAAGPASSVLTFQGREIRWQPRRSGAAEIERLQRELRAADAGLWRTFAKAMERELGS